MAKGQSGGGKPKVPARMRTASGGHASAREPAGIYESSRDVARSLASTPEFIRSMRERKKVEMLFAHLKRILKLDRLRLRGLTGAQDEFLLAATAQNLRRMSKWLMPRMEAAPA